MTNKTVKQQWEWQIYIHVDYEKGGKKFPWKLNFIQNFGSLSIRSNWFTHHVNIGGEKLMIFVNVSSNREQDEDTGSGKKVIQMNFGWKNILCDSKSISWKVDYKFMWKKNDNHEL